MLNKIKDHKGKIILAVFIVVGFGIIRAFEKTLFYDPFLVYFDSDFKGLPFPKVDVFKLFWGLLLRYFLNTVLSLLLIYVLFQDLVILKFSTFLYGCFLVVLFGVFFVILEYFADGSWLLFYVRRFIIQPIFVLLFIPAFYYQMQGFKK
ncbi:exosortase F system-associated protein [Flavobacterium circumlabens]|uniref:Exosortase F system-associated protein n=1 Tax=Flavobacterium circumlabens TaxID=2133765 RepID=A0A4Y7UHE9_9FLAO|nr:exosortase F system-associated protein [Flavobacterium circumlabens]TCN60738.1 exosortase F-associated protein [Flavobacterium circumlabens]TEB45883.1 exosortase F system-associated protein [Flavobacterium circumlabens]